MRWSELGGHQQTSRRDVQWTCEADQHSDGEVRFCGFYALEEFQIHRRELSQVLLREPQSQSLAPHVAGDVPKEARQLCWRRHRASMA